MAWIIQNGNLTNTNSVNVPDIPFRGDSPYTFWRIDPNANDGMPYVGLMIGVPVLAPEPPPSDSHIYLGNQKITKFYLGDNAVSAIFCGDQKVY